VLFLEKRGQQRFCIHIKKNKGSMFKYD
jgi:hypothetical protein